MDGKYYLVNESVRYRPMRRLIRAMGIMSIWLRTGKFTIRMTTGKKDEEGRQQRHASGFHL